jgi:hypothetical protein
MAGVCYFQYLLDCLRSFVCNIVSKGSTVPLHTDSQNHTDVTKIFVEIFSKYSRNIRKMISKFGQIFVCYYFLMYVYIVFHIHEQQ